MDAYEETGLIRFMARYDWILKGHTALMAPIWVKMVSA